ncbi:MAG TPA: amidase [Polyangiaceae bacterium]|nr:amidase [Polyangiaceae bacterium]
MSPLVLQSATRLAQRIRDGEITSAEAVEAHVARVRAVNPRLNAVVAERFEAAREEARRADEKTRTTPKGALPPLHGVPCTIKEAFALTGMPNSGGLVARRHVRASADATTVARLRAAGAIPLGVTNVSELCMWVESSNKVYGRTNNAHDEGRTCGGSSGGEGAIVGAGASPFGLGSDVGGSIRMPAFFNGVFGHKPTGGRVPSSGQFPNTTGDALLYVTTGPLARRAEDLPLLLDILEGPDGVDSRCKAWPKKSVEDVSVEGMRVLVVEGNGRLKVSRDLLAAQARAADALARRGARVEKVEIEGLRRSLEIWSAMLGTAEEVSFRDRLADGAPLSLSRELAKWMIGRSNHTLPALVLAAIEGVTKLAPAQTGRFVAMGRALRSELAERIGDGVMLYPPYPTVAPRHHEPLLAPMKFMYTCIFNVLEVPVTQVPLGLDARGLPLGVQVVGAHGNDHVTMAVAMELERQLGGWVAPRA